MSRTARTIAAGSFIAIVLAFTGMVMSPDSPDWLGLIVPHGRSLGLLLRSVLLCGGVALVDMALGVLIASAFLGRRGRGGILVWLPLVMGVLPPYLQALAWLDLFQNAALRAWGDLAAGWVMVMAGLPVGIGIAILGLGTVARAPVEAARLWRSDWAVLRRVVLPLAAPLLAAGAVFLFLLNLMDYSVPSLFGVNVYALEIFAEYSATSQPVRALLLSIPLIALAAALLPVLSGLVSYANQSAPWSASTWGARPVWPPSLVFFQNAALGIWAVQVIAPLSSLIRLSLSASTAGELLEPAGRDLLFSFGVAATAAVLSLPLSWLAMEALQRARWVQWLVILPLAIPAPLTGAAMVMFLNRPGLAGLYNSAWMPVLAGLARFSPLAIVALTAQARRVDPLLLDAARVFQKTAWHGLFRVRLPLLAPGLVAAASLVFALTLGELGATLIVLPPGQSTLSLRIYNYLHYGASDVVARLCLVVLVLSIAAGAAAAVALSVLGGRRGAHPEEGR